MSVEKHYVYVCEKGHQTTTSAPITGCRAYVQGELCSAKLDPPQMVTAK